MHVTARRPAGRRLRLPGAAAAVLVALGIAAGPAVSPARAREPQGRRAGSLEAEAHSLVNEHRRAAGLPALAYFPGIASVARRHSEAMASGATPFGHAGAAERRQRIARAIPVEGMAENVGVNNAEARRAARMTVAGWLESPGHRANIEGDYDATGVGVARSREGAWYFTQIFVKRRRVRERRQAPPRDGQVHGSSPPPAAVY